MTLTNFFIMNSEERRKARYERRQAKRKANRRKVLESIGSAEEVFNYHDMFKYGEVCCKNVMWKQSVQTFHRHLFSRTAANRKRALNNYKPKRLCSFHINERGKKRHIEAPHIDDRQIQKTFSKKVLLPLYLPRMIYDNGASLQGKGLIFSQKQMDKALRRHVKRYGFNGCIIMADFKGFFPNADKDIVKSRHTEIEDHILRRMADVITDLGKSGLPLGVEPSQIEMIALPSKLDNYMACQMGLQGFGHYMDDYHILVPPDRDPREVVAVFEEKAAELGIEVSSDKTQIIPFGKPFKYCKMKRMYKGKIIKRGCPDSIKRARRKFKKFARTEMLYEDIYTAVNSIITYFERTNNHKTVLRLRRLFFGMFGFSCEKVTYFRERGNDGVYLSQEV